MKSVAFDHKLFSPSWPESSVGLKGRFPAGGPGQDGAPFPLLSIKAYGISPRGIDHPHFSFPSTSTLKGYIPAKCGQEVTFLLWHSLYPQNGGSIGSTADWESWGPSHPHCGSPVDQLLAFWEASWECQSLRSHPVPRVWLREFAQEEQESIRKGSSRTLHKERGKFESKELKTTTSSS